MTETITAIVREIAEIPQETLQLCMAIMFLVSFAILVIWFHNKRKIQKLTHQIPASVVKNYLDSIIQNSNSLKSSLFRGGGLDVEEGMASVVAPANLSTGDSSNAHLEQEISKLKTEVIGKDATINELQSKLDSSSGADNSEEVKTLKQKIIDLEAALAAANSGSNDPSEMKAELAKVSKERDEYKERLEEYEIIEEDLANLKRLQLENAQLKKSLEEAGVAIPQQAKEENADAEPTIAQAPEVEPEAQEEVKPEPEPEAPDAPEEEAEQVAESPEPEPEIALADAEKEEVKEDNSSAIEEEDDAQAEEEVAAVGTDSTDAENNEDEEDDAVARSDDGEQKSAEELLSEFEKMLG